MKQGKLIKIEDTWFIGTTLYNGIWSELIPLHHDDVKQIEEDSKVFDNIEARIASSPNPYYELVISALDFKPYAKLISESKKTEPKLTAVEWLFNLSKQRELDKFDLEQALEIQEADSYQDYMDGYEKGWKAASETFKQDITKLYNKFNV